MALSARDIVNIVIGTAGHIDHGKSTLVRTLTGIDPDRLPEEKARGMTIDLGFAPLKLRDGRTVGIVDVPGHEKFVKNMVAGATGIDLVILIIAADDSIMPQTREHMKIMQILGIQRGIVALTKIDAVDPVIALVVQEEIQDLLEGTFMEGCPICPCSSVTREGIDKLLETIEAQIGLLVPKDTAGVFRMPIQRVFSAKGFGTIVTGIPLTGAAKIGDILEVLPLGQNGRIRGLHAYGSEVDVVRAGHSSAINFADVEYTQVHRGFVVATSGYFEAVQFVEARLRYQPESGIPLRHLTPIRFHTGTAETLGRVGILDRKEVLAGEEALVQFVLDDPVVCAPGDIFVVRIQSPVVTIGGGRVIGVSKHRTRRLKSHIIEGLIEKEKSLSDPRMQIEHAIRKAGHAGITRDEVLHETGLLEELVGETIAHLLDSGRVVPVSESKLLLHSDGLEEAGRRAGDFLAAFHKENPVRMGCPIATLRNKSGLKPEVLAVTLREEVEAGRVKLENALYRRADFTVSLSAEQRAMMEKIEATLTAARFLTPKADEMWAALKLAPDRAESVLRLLLESGTVLKLKDDVLLHKDMFEEARKFIVETIGTKGEVTPADIRDGLNTSRKYIIPLLEHMDAAGVTVRDGNRRVLPKSATK